MPSRSSVRLDNYIPDVKKRLAKASVQNIQAAVMEWHAGIVEDQLTGQRSGKLVRVPGTGKWYNVSVPGQPPATRTGRLRTSYKFRIVGTKGQEMGEVGSPLDYALYLEKGTYKMAPRPHMRPGFESRRETILRLLGRRWDE